MKGSWIVLTEEVMYITVTLTDPSLVAL